MHILPGIPPMGNHLGLLALVAYIATLLPTTLRKVFPPLRTNWLPTTLLKERRWVGVLAFVLAFGHAYFIIRKRNFDFFDVKTYIASFEGTTTFIIFTLLTITSNDWSVKRLKKDWKRLHNLTYLAMFLLTWHVLSKMAGQWTWLTPAGAIGIVVITILFLLRKWLELRKQQEQAKVAN